MRRVKIRSLAAIMALALTALVGASSASAGFIVEGGGSAAITAEETATTTFVQSGGRTTSCTGAPFSATIANGANVLTPGSMSDMSCNSSAEGTVTWKMNKCKFIFTPGSGGTGSGTVAIGPAGCGAMTWTSSYCKKSFAPQSGAATYSNVGSGSSATVQVNLAGELSYTTTEGSKAVCGTTGSGTLNGVSKVSAKVGGVQRGLHLSPQDGVFLTGEKSAEEAKQPRIAAESYPIALVGEQDPGSKHALSLPGGRTLQCTEIGSTANLGSATTSMALNASSTGCVAKIGEVELPAKIVTNSCHYTVGVLNVGPSYAGTLGVACDVGGDGIEVTLYSGEAVLCVYKFAAQAGQEGVGLSTVGTGSGRGIALNFGGAKLSAERTQGTLGSCGAKNTSSAYSGATTLFGSLNI